MYKLINTIQHYPWGSYSAIPDILGIENSERKPFAELWMGDHNRAVSKALVNEKAIPLDELINMDPGSIVGQNKDKLPFLLKILSAGKPLSIQLHPNKKEAEEGFLKENKKNIPLDAPDRTYKDDNHKPEILCAISSFTALKGFRPVKEIYNNFFHLNSKILVDELDSFYKELTSEGLKKFFSAILNFSNKKKDRLIAEAKTVSLNSEGSHYNWFLSLSKEYGNDIGVFAPFFLNIIILEPGDAIFIDAGELHAYLSGTGIELMASSDNVLRGGLTKKYINKNELLTLTNFSKSETKRVKIIKKNNGEKIYITEPDDFQLSKIELKNNGIFHSTTENTARIILCLEGRFELSNPDDGQIIQILKGESVLIPAKTGKFILKGQGTIFKAT